MSGPHKIIPTEDRTCAVCGRALIIAAVGGTFGPDAELIPQVASFAHANETAVRIDSQTYIDAKSAGQPKSAGQRKSGGK